MTIKSSMKLLTILAASALTFAASGAARAQTATTLLHSGDKGKKRNLVIIGDGFQAGAGQTAFNDYIDQQILTGVFTNGPLWESMNAFNIIRVNVSSVDSGVTQVTHPTATTTTVTTARNTALDYRFSGNWNFCWMEGGPNSAANIKAILDPLVPERDFVFVVLNDPGFGGCRTGNQLAVTLGATSTVGGHEMGHMVGALCDEYVGGSMPINYTGGEPGCINLTTDIGRNSLKWREFVDPMTPLATTFNMMTMDQAETGGAFVGGTLGSQGYNNGLWRPGFSDRMSSNTPPFGPVDYNRMKQVMDPYHDHSFVDSYVGDFNGDGRADLVLHNGNALELYLSNGQQEAPTWIQTLPLPGWDTFLSHDKFYVGDFNGDGKDDLYVVNLVDWSMPYLAMLRSTGSGFEVIQRFDRQLPGWDDMRGSDQFFVGDFDGDRKADLYVFNGSDWAVGYLGMLRSTGSDLTMVNRYDDKLPGWDSMKAHDQFFVANVDGGVPIVGGGLNTAGGVVLGTIHRKGLYVFNYGDWSEGYLESLSSTGNSLNAIARYDGVFPGWDDFLSHDRFFVADFDADNDEDLYLFNGDQWSIPYLATLRSDGGALTLSNRFDGFVDGWDKLAPHDQFYVADTNGDHRKDLYVYNASDWATEYLGVLKAGPSSSLLGSWQDDRIGGWNLGPNDRFLVGDWSGGGNGWQDLLVHNDTNDHAEFLGLLQSLGQSTRNEAVYLNWIHQQRYDSNGLWVTLP